uniref:Uncharacterized protein n=1 Tax=viral metagenome TaxID=1070528 RepID=A0A6C0LYH1_9ZZZZ
MELNEKEYSLNLIKNFNKKITFKLFNLTKNNIIFFLDFNFCNKEYLIILNKIKLLFNSKQINIFTKIIDKNVNNHTDANIIAKYYIKLTHLFSSIFNIISNNNITVKKNKINIPFNIFLIPELNYIYKSKFDLNTNKYILGQADKILYNKHLTNFCNFFLNNSEIIVNNYSDINCSNITNNKLNDNIMICESYLDKYTHNITLLIQKIKKIHLQLIKLINDEFIFEKVDEHVYIKNIISMDKLDSIIENTRDILINYFQEIEHLFIKTKHSLKIFILQQFSNTIKKRINN